MTLTLEQTARSSVFNLAHDYSTALFNHTPEMILQGQDIPIHLGSLIPAMKSVMKFFEGEINALIGACQVGARNLKGLMDKYGKELVQECIA